MITKFFSSKLRIALAELKHLHRMELEEKAANFDREKKVWEEDKQRHIQKLTDEHEIKLKEAVTLAKLNSEQKIKQAELDAHRAYNTKAEALNKDYYDKLSVAMTKLHEEGNITTKFTQDLALKMFEHAPKNISETKVPRKLRP